MKKVLMFSGIFILALVFSVPLFAGEHGGREHGGKEHDGKMTKTPSADEIRSTMKNYVESNYKNGTLRIKDKEKKVIRKLKLVRVHERVGKTGDYYYSCADFKDTKTGDMLDLDIDVKDKNGKLKVVDIRIHKLNGVERYTYDENDNRISLKSKASSHEHGGKEHGGS